MKIVKEYKRARKTFDSMPESQEKWEVAYPELQEKIAALPRAEGI
jgi:hypothetical protein